MVCENDPPLQTITPLAPPQIAILILDYKFNLFE